MNQRVSGYVNVGIVLLVLSGFVFLVYWAMSSFFSYVSSVQKEVGVALIAGSATVIVSTLTIVVGRYFERKKERDALHREKKAQIYDEFLKSFFDHFFSGTNSENPEELISFFREFMRKLLLWSDPDTINAFVKWKDHLSKGIPDAQTIFLTEAFLLAIRKDLRHDNSGLKEGLFARLFLQNAPLFLSLAKKNPNITLSELGEFEAHLRTASAGQGVDVEPNQS